VEAVDLGHVNDATGPILVEGVEPGDIPVFAIDRTTTLVLSSSLPSRGSCSTFCSRFALAARSRSFAPNGPSSARRAACTAASTSATSATGHARPRRSLVGVHRLERAPAEL
jgi:hypothetical protein